MRQSFSLRALVVRSALLGLVATAALSGVLWATELAIGRIGIISLGSSTDLFIRHGVAQVRHRYEYDIAPPVPTDQWFATAVSRGWVDPPTSRGAKGFGFSSGHVMGIGGAQLISPARYWLLHAPLWAGMVPGIVAGAWLAAQWQRKRQARRRGFSVVTTSTSPLPAA